MGTMVVSLDGIHRGSFAGSYGQWRHQTSPPPHAVDSNITRVWLTLPTEISRKGLTSRMPQHLISPQSVASTNDITRSSLPTTSSEIRHRPPPISRVAAVPVFGASSRNNASDNSASSTSKDNSSLTFTSQQSQQAQSSSSETFSFTSCRSLSISQQGGNKRRRPLTDVDGPNTASLGCKKRRLRHELITSRLSQPFSLPATHILNREAVAAGDKRFLKLAAVVAARKLNTPIGFSGPGQQHGPSPSGFPAPTHHHPAQSEMLRRAAILNRFRLRVCVEAEQRGDKSVVAVAASASLLAGSAGLHGLGFVANARMPSPENAGSRPPDSGTVSSLLRLPPAIVNPPSPHPLSRAAAVARSSPPGSPSKALRPVDSADLVLPPPHNLRALRSPVLKASQIQIDRVMDEDELDDDNVAFPTSEHESRYDSGDDPDDVYADFSVIFGGGSEPGSEDEDDRGSDHDHYEDYMDDLDGIPYTLR